jgi:hypothetical protein
MGVRLTASAGGRVPDPERQRAAQQPASQIARRIGHAGTTTSTLLDFDLILEITCKFMIYNNYQRLRNLTD